VAAFGSAGVAVDGVPLAPIGESELGSHQFLPEAPLALGQHELLITVGNPAGYRVAPGATTSVIAFEVAEGAGGEITEDATITGVTTYPIVSGAMGERLSPTEAVFDDDCSADAVPLVAVCHDTGGPSSVVRVDLDTDPAALAYVVGDYLLPATCRALVTDRYETGSPAFLSIAAVLPTGLGAPSYFAGTIEGVPAPAEHDRGWCSVSPGTAPGNAWAFGLSGVGVALLRRWRRK
jgi:MYXO-CTERM domain-containing protein